MRKEDRLYRVVTFLKREELDVLDNLVKDIYFTYGIKVSRARLVEEIISEFKSKGVVARKELIDRILASFGANIERRKFPRLKKSLLVGLRILDSLEKYQDCVTENISLGGCKIDIPFSYAPPAVNQMVELILRSPEEEKLEPIKALARVVWLREKEQKQGYEMGVMLTYIRKEDRERFANYLKKEKEIKNEIEQGKMK